MAEKAMAKSVNPEAGLWYLPFYRGRHAHQLVRIEKGWLRWYSRARCGARHVGGVYPAPKSAPRCKRCEERSRG